jgi:hypothetical protein
MRSRGLLLALAPALFAAGCRDRLPFEPPVDGRRVPTVAQAAPAARLVAWGANDRGQVSNLPAGTDFVSASAGRRHGVAVRSNGTLVSWGDDVGGVVTGTPAGDDFTAAAAGYGHSIALRADGSLVSWGDDNSGVVTGTPVASNFIAVAAGGAFSVAIRSDGSLVAWGASSKTTVPGGTSSAVSAGLDHGVALQTTGTLASWGSNTSNQVSGTPSGDGFVAADAGSNFSTALRADGSLVSWGSNLSSQVSNTPTGNLYAAVSAGGSWGLALRTDGTLVSWGSNGGNAVTHTPQSAGFLAVSAGDSWGLALQHVAAPAAPPALAATHVPPTQIDLVWDDVDGETGYVLERRIRFSIGAWSAWSTIATPDADALDHSDTGLHAWTSYQYGIRACNSAGCSPRTRSALVTTGPPPGPAELGAGAVSASQIDLSWENQGGSARYVLHRRQRLVPGEWGDSERIAILDAGAESYGDTGLDAWGTYRYILRACNPAGCSDRARSPVITTPGPPGAPPAPGSFAATAASPTRIDLTWDDVDNESHYVIGRRVRVEGSWSAWQRSALIPADVTAHADEGLTPGTEYQHRVRACNPDACSTWMNGPETTTPGG